MKLQIKVEGMERLESVLSNLTNGANTSSLMDEVGKAGVQMIQHRIRVEKESPDGQSWAPSQDGGSTLYRTGGLAGSIKYEAGVNTVEIGTDWPYASIHNYGATIRSNGLMKFQSDGHWWSTREVHIPQREFMGWSDANIREIDAIIENKILSWLPRF